MTIVMIGQKGLPARSGGIERHVSNLAAGLVSLGHRVIVYGRRWYVGDAVAPVGVEQRFTPGIHTKHLDAITHSFTALVEARRVRPDIIHLHGTGIALLSPIARVLHPRAKIIVTFHCLDRVLSKWNGFAKRMFRLGEWLACHTAHRTIVVSQTLSRYCAEAYHCQTTYITHPFALPEASPSQDPLASFDLKPDQFLLFVARLIPDKNAHVLLEAYDRARASRPDLFSDVPLVCVGGSAWTSTYVQGLYAQAASIPGVMMLGERFDEELSALQGHAMAHVFPTASEGLAFSMLEAGAYARPAIMTDLPQNEEALGPEAIRIAVNDVEGLAQGLIRVAQMGAQEREAVGRNLRAHVQKTFSSEKNVRAVACLYEEALNGSSTIPTEVAAVA